LVAGEICVEVVSTHLAQDLEHLRLDSGAKEEREVGRVILFCGSLHV